MTPIAPATAGIWTWPRRAEAWLDARGRPAWIAAIVAGFVAFWPAGLALLAYTIWSRRMFTTSCRNRRRDRFGAGFGAFRPSGNTAFDAYKAETLQRLEQEQEEFAAFLRRLREARDKQEFDAFMTDRARPAAAQDDPAPAADPRAAGY